MSSVYSTLQPFIGVIVLAVVFFILVSLINRYRGWQAQKMHLAQQLLSGAQEVEYALSHMSGMQLPQELGEFCRQELIERYVQVSELFPSMEEVKQRLQEVEAMHPGQGNWEPPLLENQAQLKSYNLGLSAILDILSNRGAKSLKDVEAVRALREQVRGFRAQTQFAYYAKHARQCAEAGEWGMAQKEALALMDYLKAKAPANEMGKALYQQAGQLYHQFLHQVLPNEDKEQAA